MWKIKVLDNNNQTTTPNTTFTKSNASKSSSVDSDDVTVGVGVTLATIVDRHYCYHEAEESKFPGHLSTQRLQQLGIWGRRWSANDGWERETRLTRLEGGGHF